ncbi:MarR family transcriptional regulator [Endozoicomonas sp. 4G]|uniref:LexA family protein n=1 Tax=Endozoicomonas sp. 4G TaxID=2872754 RepID=UPI00207856AA|nr:MarR family transcriptional regulator [Endozoicomonas sp. 4G]
MSQEPIEFTELQGQYLSFIYNFTKINGIPPAESDLQKYFKVTAPTVHQMVIKLHKLGLISQKPHQPRTMKVEIPIYYLPYLE